jgi:luciferase family oxidoreductase group 1
VQPNQPMRAVPGAGLDIPIWLLGSSLFSAQLAGEMGLPFAFASHFAPDYLMRALDLYRTSFKPSDQLEKPYAMAGLNVFAADTEGEAKRLFTSLQQQFINLRRGTPGPLPPPVDDMAEFWSPMEQQMVAHSLRYAIVGTPTQVEAGLAEFITATEIDEVMVTGQIFDHAARLHSFEIVAAARDRLASRNKVAAGR